jgi:membrane associated rhomboid family serine protease
LEPLIILIGINLLFFVAVHIRPDLLNYLALTPAEVWRQPWQIITSVFTHYDIFHIFANMLTLYFFGQAILQMQGERRFWLIYLLGGIAGSLVFIALGPLTGNQYTSAIGASGAVFALGGALAVLYPQMRVMIFPIPAPMPIWIAVVGSFVVLSFIPGNAWQAHLGGLAFGAAAGYVFKKNQFRRWR